MKTEGFCEKEMPSKTTEDREEMQEVTATLLLLMRLTWML